MLRKVAVITVALLAVVLFQPATAIFGVETDPADGPAVLDEAPEASHRLIVELESPAVAEWATASSADLRLTGIEPAPADIMEADGRLDTTHPAALAHEARLAAEQDTFLSQLESAAPDAELAAFIDESGQRQPLRYSVVFNGVAIDSGLGVGASLAEIDQVAERIQQMPGVVRVHRDLRQDPHMYMSLDQINAQAAWDMAGGQDDAGAGIKVASMDGGVHHEADMFDGTGFSYPPGYPIGYLSNTNGKIIASRAYFRDWDPPEEGDDTPWPGVSGTSHGVHTAGTAAGNPVEASYFGITLTLSGVAPSAYVMSYRVFYNSVNGIGSFYNAEGLAALEDIVRDGADVVNNSWGGGPGSFGGPYDALDVALRNAWSAGVFVSMSNGNAGPGLGTGDHPSEDYINVAAITTGGDYASGFLSVTAPEPVSDSLKQVDIGTAGFGISLPPGVITGPFAYNASANVDAANIEGCDPFEAGVFDGVAALIMRGTCNFSLKAAHAQDAGATMVVIYNSEGNDSSFGMAPGTRADEVAIPVISIGNVYGDMMVAWETEHGDAAMFEVSTEAFQVGNDPDTVINFSSRGPSVAFGLKPDIGAPGVNIISAGYGLESGEGRHLGYGQISGTSMAAPHVAGAAALLKQLRPEWTNAEIKSALMTTSKFMDIYTASGAPAQPLDTGAGRLDLTNAADPGFIASPPSLSYGVVVSGTQQTIDIELSSVSDSQETYQLSTVYTGESFTQTTEVAGVSVEPAEVTLLPGESATVSVTWDTTTSMGYGDNQGHLLVEGTEHMGHLPMWMRVARETPRDILVLDNDGSGFSQTILDALQLDPFTNYTPVYTETLEALGYVPCGAEPVEMCYDVYDADANAPANTHIPDQSWLAQYETIIYQTGDNNQGNDVLPLTHLDANRMVEYLNGGGKVIAFGQDLSSVLRDSRGNLPFFYGYGLGAEYLSNSVSGGDVITQTLKVLTGVRDGAFSDINVDVSGTGDGARNQARVDEIAPESESLSDPLLMSATSDQVREHGYVAMGRRDQPTLDRPGIATLVDSAYFAFGLEGVNNDTGLTTRQELLDRAMDYVHDMATVTITPTVQPTHDVTYFEAAMESTHTDSGAVRQRWDFGDGSDYTEWVDTRSMTVGHRYREPGTYTVRVESVNDLGTRIVESMEITVPEGGEYVDDGGYTIFLPWSTNRFEFPSASLPPGAAAQPAR